MERNKLLPIVELNFILNYVGKNRDIDLEQAKADTLFAFDKTDILFDESFRLATDFFSSNIDVESRDEYESVIDKTLEICPHYYYARYLKIIEIEDTEQEINELEKLREEIKHKYDSIGFYIDESPSIFGARFADSYHLILSRLVFANVDINQFNQARKYAEMMYRLDKYNIKDSLYDYVYTLILNEKYDLAYSLIKDTNLVQYNYLKYFIYALTNKNDKAFKLFKIMSSQNPYYGLITTGAIDDYEEFLPAFDDYQFGYYLEYTDNQLLSAMINTIRINRLLSIATTTKYFDICVEKQLEYFIDIPDIEKFIISRIAYQPYNQSKLYEEAVEDANFDIQLNEFVAHLNILVKKGYIEKEKNKYQATPFAMYLTKFIISITSNLNDND